MKRGREEKGELNCLMLLSKVGVSEATKPLKECGFKCKTCNKEFSSFQALGGHRASHKRPKLMDKLLPTMKPKMHQCPICGLEFSIGQALGGHMRKHNNGFSIIKNSKDYCVKLNSCLDLNLTPLENGIAWT